MYDVVAASGGGGILGNLGDDQLGAFFSILHILSQPLYTAGAAAASSSAKVKTGFPATCNASYKRDGPSVIDSRRDNEGRTGGSIFSLTGS